jgi:flagellar basal body L-ring protein FlgH
LRSVIPITVLIFLTLFQGMVSSKSIWRERNVYSSANNIRVGDILIVNVNDISNMRFTLDINSRTTSDISSNPDVTITGFLPKVSANKNLSYRNSTSVSEKGQLNLSIAASVVRRGAGRSYAITGTRTYSFNGTTNTITVSGLIDPFLINGRNVDSSHVVNFRIQIRGRGEGIPITRPQLKEKETADSALTEQEKQQIIIDYLQKMLAELVK